MRVASLGGRGGEPRVGRVPAQPGIEGAEVAVEQGVAAVELRVAAVPGLGVEPVDGAQQSRLVDADLGRQLRQGVGAVEVVGHLSARRDAEDPELRPVVLVEDQPRRGVRHGARLRVDLAHDLAELVVGQGLVREALTLAVHHDAVRQRSLAQEHPAERAALQLLAGQLHAGHPPGVLHAGQVGAHLLRPAAPRCRHGPWGRPARRRARRGRSVVSSAELSNPPLASSTPLVARTVCSTPSARDDDAAHPRLVRDEPGRGRLDAYVDAVAQAGLEQRADQCRSGQPDVVDAHPAQQPERERVLGHARRQGRSHELRGLPQSLGGVRAGKSARPTDAPSMSER